MVKKKKITGGIYLVLDPSMDRGQMFRKLKEVLESGIAAVQIWDNFSASANPVKVVDEIVELCRPFEVPVLLNNDLKLLKSTKADGVHFDEIPQNFEEIRIHFKGYLFGLTCSNDLRMVEWAEKCGMDYISFCSVFPSQTSNSCELISFETIQEARPLTAMPLFLAGGISIENMQKLKELDFDGVAVVSGIMGSETAGTSTMNYANELKNLKNENSNF